MTTDDIRESLLSARHQMSAEYKKRMAAIDQALQAFDESSEGEDLDRVETTRGISPKKFEMVREYMRRHKRAVQVQIAKDLSASGEPFNSGSASVALSRMLKTGEVRKAGKEKGPTGYPSQVWEWTGEDDGLPAWAVRSEK